MNSTATAGDVRATRGHRRRRSTSNAATRLLAVFAAVGAGLAATALAWHHPLAPTFMAVMALAVAAASFQWPRLWPLLLPALLPVIGLAPWSGWITFEEMDILVLSMAAGSYLRIAAAAAARRPGTAVVSDTLYAPASLALSVVVLISFAALTGVAMLRGFVDAGGFAFGWFQGYHEPMNALRIAKAFLLALLLLPPWLHASRTQSLPSGRALAIGASAGLALASLATIWERMAFTGLLNFSADYRTTALFWEMHVGGAALDGFLALTIPFAVALWMRARGLMAWSACTAVLLMAGYAALTTFSRGVYLAVPIGLVVFAALEHSRRRAIARSAVDLSATRRDTGQKPPALAFGTGTSLVLAYLVGTFWMFPTSGYRGILALLGATALALPLARIARSLSSGHRITGIVLGVLLGAGAGLCVWIPKGAYVAWIALAAGTACCEWAWLRSARRPAPLGVLALGGLIGTTMATAWVALNWGGVRAFQQAAPVTLLLALSVVATSFRSTAPWPESARWQSSIVAIMALVSGLAGVFGGGVYMSGRFATGSQDLDGRFEHWRIGRDMLVTPADWWFGKGLGRYASSYFLTGDPAQHPGDYRYMREGDNGYLRLTGGLHVQGFGEMFRVTQRIAPPGPAATITMRVRAEKETGLHLEACPKHLLYVNYTCALVSRSIKALPGEWQTLSIPFPAANVTRGDWYAPRLLAFSMATTTRGGSLDIDDLTLTTSAGVQLLANGDFSDSMAHWFFSSDRNHLPWHAKSLPLHLLIEQGALSVAVFTVMVVAALWHTSLGSARREPLAPALAASIVGFLVVGLFDSLLDVPRVALLFYWLLAVAMCLHFKPLVATTRVA